MQIKDNTFIVTGGSSGLGEACVRRLAGLGANVLIADVNDVGQAVADELGDNVIFCHTDVSNEENVATTVAKAVEVFGGVHGLVNCAGILIAAKVLSRRGNFRMSGFSKVINVNLIGTFNMIRDAADAMAKQDPNDGGERGVIINTASVAAYDGQIGQAAYSASKGGLVGMTLPIARELARSGIRVMTIAPGIFDTAMLAGLPEPARISLGQQVPFPARLGDPDEYAHLVQHIIENAMLNGEVIRLDGAIRLAPN
jgi:NAD(P)-dependent dehydrogenase (short-subunit alcohol dehydrogenase family)